MPFNTATVGTAVTPTVVSTLLHHYLNRKQSKLRALKPTAHISYDEGLALVRQFLIYASHHTVEDLQGFTAQKVPKPAWVKTNEVTIPESQIIKAATLLQAQLGPDGIDQVGGKMWWQWRPPGSELRAEWIEMRADYLARKKTADNGRRVMFYVHGGAYFFGSVDVHRYQLQRHARKLNARVFAPRYRLAPQFPFPAPLQDCLAAYLYLLATGQDASTIVMAGDSAGGGMVVSLLCILRDQGLPLPAGAVLISPWVDLTHSFSSVAGESHFDYVPPHGFHQRPSASWPPPNSDDLAAIMEALNTKEAVNSTQPHGNERDSVVGFHLRNQASRNHAPSSSAGPNVDRIASIPGENHNISVMVDGKAVEVIDQIHMYTTNTLLSHPLVSPALQPSLGGLPPLLILTGGGEILRDEQIYLAHKAAAPSLYPPPEAFLANNPVAREQINAWKPTNVQLQVWDDLCHVAPTLSFTRPAKHMYRSVAQFSAWSLARAQKRDIEILDDDAVSVISRSSSSDLGSPHLDEPTKGAIGKAGDPLPAFHHHMIRQRVDRDGRIFPLAPASELPACTMPREEIGSVKAGPARRWMAAKEKFDRRFAREKRNVQRRRVREMGEGYVMFGDGEVPPPSALAGRRVKRDEAGERKKRTNWGLGMWSLWGSEHDKQTIQRELQAVEVERAAASPEHGAGAGQGGNALKNATLPSLGEAIMPHAGKSRSRSRSVRISVTDQNQTGERHVNENTPAAELVALQDADGKAMGNQYLTPEFAARMGGGDGATNEERNGKPARPKMGGEAFPFSVRMRDEERPESAASMATLTSQMDVRPAAEVTEAHEK